ncbi:MAG: hypothetical protein M3R70_12770 [Actinomycetota bacterium]|nr:hypothetical protein [Actinomycetota bacterium]
MRPLLVGLLAALVLAGGAQATSRSRVGVTVDRTELSTKLGHKLSFRSTITNHGSTSASGLVAHLNVLSLRTGVYVDPEDWSSKRTRFLDTIPAGGSTALTWKLEAVNAGSLGVYVAVLPESGAGAPVTSPTVHVRVAERKTLNSGGILPLALGVPALLGALALGLRLRRRR